LFCGSYLNSRSIWSGFCAWCEAGVMSIFSCGIHLVKRPSFPTGLKQHTLYSSLCSGSVSGLCILFSFCIVGSGLNVRITATLYCTQISGVWPPLCCVQDCLGYSWTLHFLIYCGAHF
jgi:hypothetical protein